MRLAGTVQRRRGVGRAVIGAFVAMLAAPVVIATSPASAESRTRLGPNAVSIDVVSVSPSVPAPSNQLEKLRIELSITNNTNEQLNNVQITATRDLNPLTTEGDLVSALTHTSASVGAQPIVPVRPVSVDLLPADESAAMTTTFVTTTAVPTDLKPGLCLCANDQVYSVWFQAMNGAQQLLGQTQTFVPSFDDYRGPNPIHVSWVWPLIDQPHRVDGGTVFTDDNLATSISTGRLNRCLQVLESIAGKVPVTVVIDPELLDELEIMATQKYTYRAASGKLVRGTGQAAAQQWLARLQAVLRDNTQVSVVLTPYADPDVASLTRAQLSWSATLPPAEQQRVQTALGGVTPSTAIAWPPSGTISRPTLQGLYGTGVRSLLLNGLSVRPNSDSATTPFTLGRLAIGGHPVATALTSPALSRYVAAALGGDPTGSGLPTLMAGLALLSGGQNTAGQQVFLAPSRYIDPAVSSATNAIEGTSSSVLTRPANLAEVLAGAAAAPLQQAPSAVPAHLVAPPHPPVGLSRVNLRIAHRMTNEIASLKSMFDRSGAARRLMDQFYGGVQRAESAAWRNARRQGIEFARQLRKQVHQLTKSVHIVIPASRSRRYTLASTNSPLPITVENDLPYRVDVQVAVHPVNGIPGLNAGEVGPQVIAPNSKSTLRVPTQVQRSGLFRVYAVLQTPQGQQIGRRVPLLVTSTALGTIGVVITVVSGAILVLALLIRFARRMRARSRPPNPRHRRSPASAGPAPLEPDEPVAPVDEPVAPFTETIASPGAAPPPAAPGH